MALSKKVLEKLTEMQGRANQAFNEGRKRYVCDSGTMWSTDPNEVSGRVIELVEDEGWDLTHAFMGAMGLTFIFRRDESRRVLR